MLKLEILCQNRFFHLSSESWKFSDINTSSTDTQLTDGQTFFDITDVWGQRNLWMTSDWITFF